MIYYCIVHSIVVPRLVQNKSLPINLTKMSEKMNKKLRTSIVYVFWKKVDGLFRTNVEMIQNIARNFLTHTQPRTHGGEPTRNQKEKLDVRMIRTTAV